MALPEQLDEHPKLVSFTQRKVVILLEDGKRVTITFRKSQITQFELIYTDLTPTEEAKEDGTWPV